MSRDVITIIIVLFCIAALIFLIVKTVNLSSSGVNEPGKESNFLYEDPSSGGTGGTGEAETPAFPDTDSATVGENEQPSEEYADKDETVVTEETPVEEPERQVPAAVDRSGDYLVIAGSFRFRQNAENEASRLRRLGYNNAEVALFNRGAYASVIISRFSDPGSAQDLVRELKSQHGIEAYIQAKKTEGAN